MYIYIYIVKIKLYKKNVITGFTGGSHFSSRGMRSCHVHYDALRITKVRKLSSTSMLYTVA